MGNCLVGEETGQQSVVSKDDYKKHFKSEIIEHTENMFKKNGLESFFEAGARVSFAKVVEIDYGSNTGDTFNKAHYEFTRQCLHFDDMHALQMILPLKSTNVEDDGTIVSAPEGGNLLKTPFKPETRVGAFWPQFINREVEKLFPNLSKKDIEERSIPDCETMSYGLLHCGPQIKKVDPDAKHTKRFFLLCFLNIEGCPKVTQKQKVVQGSEQFSHYYYSKAGPEDVNNYMQLDGAGEVKILEKV